MKEHTNITWAKLYLAVRISTAVYEAPLSRQAIADHFAVPIKRLSSWETVADIREQDIKELAAVTGKAYSWFTEPLSTYGDKVHASRLLLKLTENEFAARLGVTKDTIHRLETHQSSSINSTTLHKICELTAIPSSWFLNKETEPPSIKAIPATEGLAYQQRKAAELFSKLGSENRILAIKLLEKLCRSERAED